MISEENREIQKLLSLIGLARKAGKLTVGTEAVCDAIRGGKVKLVIASAEASDNTKKRISNCAEYYGVCAEYVAVSPDMLGKAIGKTATACVSIDDETFVKLITSNL